MSVLVDTSVWIDYFRGKKTAEELDLLIEENLIVTNQVILAELIPPLSLQNQKPIIRLLKEIKLHPLDIDWNDIVKMQIICIKNGINRVGLPDLMVAQNAIQNSSRLYSLDKHFTLISKQLPLTLYD